MRHKFDGISRFRDSLGVIFFSGAFVGLMLLSADGRTIQWGGSVFDVNLQSDGSDVTSTFQFQLGTFGSDFQPSAVNILDDSGTNLWASNWHVFDESDYNEAAGFFSSSEVVIDNGVFGSGDQAYIWIYNDQNPGPESEWALLTSSSWQIPEADAQAPALEWRVSDVDTVIYGAANGVIGAGERTVNPGNFDIQTFSFAPVPEPNALFMWMIGMLYLGGRRRR